MWFAGASQELYIPYTITRRAWQRSPPPGFLPTFHPKQTSPGHRNLLLGVVVAVVVFLTSGRRPWTKSEKGYQKKG